MDRFFYLYSAQYGKLQLKDNLLIYAGNYELYKISHINMINSEPI